MKKMYSEPKVEKVELKTEDIIQTSTVYNFTVRADNEGANRKWD